MSETTFQDQTDVADADVTALLAIPAEEGHIAVSAERFAVTDDRSANWLMRRVVEARDYKERVKEFAAKEIRRAEAQEERLLYLFGAQLRAWITAELARRRSRTKSINLPAGCCGFRKEAAKLVIVDQQLLIDWARSNCPSAVVVEERLLKTPVNEHFGQTGEVPPGTTLQEELETFYIR